MALTASVIPGAVIMAPWGNEIRDRVIQLFASSAERDVQWPAATAPNGATCRTLNDGKMFFNFGGTWVEQSAGQSARWWDGSGPPVIPSSTPGVDYYLDTASGDVWKL